jgi:hypothetical protein
LGGTNNRILLVAFFCLLCSSSALAEFGGTALLLWPTARSVALGGAMTALADEPDAEFWNPGGLCFQHGASAAASGRRWLNVSDLRYLSAGWGFSRVAGTNLDINAGANARYFPLDSEQVTDETGRLIGSYRPWEAAVGVHGGIGIGDRFGVGLALKYFHALYMPGWIFDSLGYSGSNEDFVANALAADVGVLYRPLNQVSVGLALSNLGSGIRYNRQTAAANLPTTARLGVCCTPVDIPLVRARLLGEASLILSEESTPFSDAAERLWKTAAAEVTVLQLITARISYLWVRDYWSLWRGLRYGVGVGYKDYIRFDVARDRPFAPLGMKSQWVLGLAVNNLPGLVAELKHGPKLDWSW